MQTGLFGALQALRPGISERWEAVLRMEPVNTPLANPDALVYLIDWTIDQTFELLRPKEGAPTPLRTPSERAPDCPCGRNPLLAFFVAGRQAILEALVLAQSKSEHLVATERDRDMAEVSFAIRELRHREVAVFCSLCQHRRAGPRPALDTRVAEQLHA